MRYNDDIISKHVYLNQDYKVKFQEQMRLNFYIVKCPFALMCLIFVLAFVYGFGLFHIESLLAIIISVIFLVIIHFCTKRLSNHAIRGLARTDLDNLIKISRIDMNKHGKTYSDFRNYILSCLLDISHTRPTIVEGFSNDILSGTHQSLADIAQKFGIIAK